METEHHAAEGPVDSAAEGDSDLFHPLRVNKELTISIDSSHPFGMTDGETSTPLINNQSR